MKANYNTVMQLAECIMVFGGRLSIIIGGGGGGGGVVPPLW